VFVRGVHPNAQQHTSLYVMLSPWQVAADNHCVAKLAASSVCNPADTQSATNGTWITGVQGTYRKKQRCLSVCWLLLGCRVTQKTLEVCDVVPAVLGVTVITVTSHPTSLNTLPSKQMASLPVSPFNLLDISTVPVLLTTTHQMGQQ